RWLAPSDEKGSRLESGTAPQRYVETTAVTSTGIVDPGKRRPVGGSVLQERLPPRAFVSMPGYPAKLAAEAAPTTAGARVHESEDLPTAARMHAARCRPRNLRGEMAGDASPASPARRSRPLRHRFHTL